MKRAVLAYLLFVGVPFAALLGVLHLGGRLQAPLAVHGSYAVGAPTGPASAGCVGHLLAMGDSAVTVTQSGPDVTVYLGGGGDIVLSGTIRDTDITADGTVPRDVTPAAWGCQPGSQLHLAARLVRSPHEKRLVGSIGVQACADCTAVAFAAVRPRGYAEHRRS